jgi:hypothetical protein
MTISQPCDLTSQAMPRRVQYFVIALTKMRVSPGIAGPAAVSAEISCCIAHRCGKLIAYFNAELAWFEPFAKNQRHAFGSLQDRVSEG